LTRFDSIKRTSVILFILILSSSLMRPSAPQLTVRGDSTDLSSVVSGVSSICAVGVPGPLFALNSTPVPIVAGDEDTTPFPSIVAMASSLGSGRVIALGHDGFLTNEALGLFDNKLFGDNVVGWLDKLSRKKVLVTTGHSEWYGGSNFNDFKSELENHGYTVTRSPATITSSALSDVGVVLIGNAWGTIFQSEIDALRDFVASGGGLFIIGLGWSWEPYNPGSTLDDYPMNKLGAIFGIRWIDGYISDPTNNYNGQPVFHTFYPNIELQTVYQAFSYIETTTANNPSGLPSLLQNDASVRRKYTQAHLLLATATMELSQSSTQRQEIYDFYKNLFSSYPQYFSKNAIYDRGTQSAMAWIRERAYRSFLNSLLYGGTLTSNRKNEIATAIGLTDRYLDIWNDFSVLLLDNTDLNQKQKDFIYAYLKVVPQGLHDLHAISVIDDLGTLPPSTPEISLWGKDDGVNIFGFDIGAMQENGFPNDVQAQYSDVFCLVVAHEVNHIVDAFYVSKNTLLSNRKSELIGRAGNNHMNYLRSMLPDGFFATAPQEFFASISNQWFANTSRTLELALVRFNEGYKESLNQFLFFADVYSLGDGYTVFYTMDTQGHIERMAVPINRDQNGHISSLTLNGLTYYFTLDEKGNVLGAQTVQDSSPPSIADLSYSPHDPTPEDEVNVSVIVTDLYSGVKAVNLLYSTDEGKSWNSLAMNPNVSNYTAVIPKQPDGTAVQFKVSAKDNADNYAESNVTSYTVHAPPSAIPGFPVEAVVIGMVIAVFALIQFRKRRSVSHTIEIKGVSGVSSRASSPM